MAEGGGEDRVGEDFSFVDRVRYMMYGEKEKEAFLIEKKEKEEKKKAKLEASGKEAKSKKPSMLGQIKSHFVPQTPKENLEEPMPSQEQIEEDTTMPASPDKKEQIQTSGES